MPPTSCIGQFNHPGLGFLDLISLLLSWFKSEMPEQMLNTHEERPSRCSR